MAGPWILKQPWVEPCVRSWSNIRHRDPVIRIIADPAVDVRSTSFPLVAPECAEFDAGAQQTRVTAALARYPSLSRVREYDFTWRKLIDSVHGFDSTADYLLLVDTDVYVRRAVSLETTLGFDPDVVYLREDIPAYRGCASAALERPIVRSFNAGFVLFRPELVDLEFLDFVCRRYVLPLRSDRLWWSEQLAWALLAGRASRPRVWDGSQCRVVSGLGTRSPADMRANRVRLLPCRGTSGYGPDGMHRDCEDASVIHLAGPAKRYWNHVLPIVGASEIDLPTFADEPVSGLWRFGLAARMALRNASQRLSTLRP